MAVLKPSPLRIPEDAIKQREWLADLLATRQPESYFLDYKESRAILEFKRDAFSKDVGAMANSRGGVLIYGVIEKKDSNGTTLPERYDPIPSERVNLEGLDQQCRMLIDPPIDGVRIVAITPAGEVESGKCIVIEVPQSDTAHMSDDGRHYRRNNITTSIMRGFEIRDILNRKQLPEVKAQILMTPAMNPSREVNTDICEVKVRLANVGKLICMEYLVVVLVPAVIRQASAIPAPDNRLIRPVMAERGWCYPMALKTRSALFPGMNEFLEFLLYLHVNHHEKMPGPGPLQTNEFGLRICADNMEPREEWLTLDEVYQHANPAIFPKLGPSDSLLMGR